MQDIEDRALLGQYAATGSEEAFRMLVERNVNLVYSVALRQAGNPSQAEEITQAVFVLLARKAKSVGRGAVLSGWLYHATRLTAANAARAEFRRVRREQEAYMQSLAHENSPDAWTRIAPLLESAMGDLNPKERDAIVLRYFQDRSMTEVARAFGGSENAAKKRVQRALEKLRNYFAKHKIVLTTAIIAGAVSANSVQAAPAGLAASATAIAVKGAAASTSTLTLIKGALKIMAWTKAKTALVTGAVILLAAGTTTVAVKEIALHHDDSVWENLTEVDSRQLEAAPPTVAIRPAKLGPRRGGTVWAGAGKRMGFGASVVSLLSDAYDVSADRIVDTAALPAGKYDFIVSLPAHQSKALQAKIKETLGLVGKREMRDTDVLLLTVARNGAPGLRPASATDSGRGFSSNGGQYSCQNMAIANLANFLESYLKMPVIDQTGLTGRFDIDLKVGGPDAAKQAVLDQLGLQLTPATQPLEVLVVEKVK